jgi:two-component system, LytTR family, sensor kinase
MVEEKKRFPILLHIIGWIALFVLPQFLIFASNQEMDLKVLWRLIPVTLILMIIFYLNYFILIPRLTTGKWKGLYPLVAVATIIVMYLFLNLGIKQLMSDKHTSKDENKKEYTEEVKRTRRGPDPRTMATYNFFILSVLVTVFAYVLRVSEKAKKSERERRELEKARLNSELAFLKNQVSPHFFFNTLNNIYSLIEINTGDAREAVHNLSRMMRYLLYKSEHGNTSLGDEIVFMRNYIDLMKLRLSNKVKMDVNFTQSFNDLLIPPLLFIPFIENAFKHGISLKKNSSISISLEIIDDELVFASANTINLEKGDNPEPESGIGLENVRKRLSLLLPGKHNLSISSKGGIFEVILKILIK